MRWADFDLERFRVLNLELRSSQSGMAVVLKATEVGLRRAVALKVLPPDVGLTPRAVERLLGAA